MKVIGRIKCKCSNEFEFKGECECVESNVERAMGVERCYETELDEECPKCGETMRVSAKCWEYPMGAVNHIEVSVSEGSVVDSRFE